MKDKKVKTGGLTKEKANKQKALKKTGWDSLTEKQRLFVNYFLENGMTNASQAAKLAGYSEYGKEGYRLRNDPEILEILSKKVKERGGINDIAIDNLMGELRAMVMGSISDFLSVDKGKINIVDWEDLSPEMLKMVKSVKYDQYGHIVYTFYDKMDAMEKLMKIFNLDNIGKRVKLDLPKLDSMTNALKYIEGVGEAAANGIITIDQATQLSAVAKDFVKAKEVGDINDQLDEMRELLEQAGLAGRGVEFEG